MASASSLTLLLLLLVHTALLFVSGQGEEGIIGGLPAGSAASTVPALPVEWQAANCMLDLNNQVLGGVRQACGMGTVERARCCPVLAAWLMAARAKVALSTPVTAGPMTGPLLPDDSMVCVANMKAALDARGLHLPAPNATCDLVFCFCGIRLNEISMANCPSSYNSSSFSSSSSSIINKNNDNNNNNDNYWDKLHEPSSSSSSFSMPILPGFELAPTTAPAPAPAPVAQAPVSGQHGIGEKKCGKNNNNTNYNKTTPLQALFNNCKDHSYKGCTRCLNALIKMRAPVLRKPGMSKAATLDCDLMGLISLLATNKTLYIPTVSAVLRALMYSNRPHHVAMCSPDWANMPLALDSSEFEQEDLVSLSPAPIHNSTLSLFRCLLVILLPLLLLYHHY